MTFSGGVTAEQDRDLMSGDTLYGTLNEQKHLQNWSPHKLLSAHDD